MLLTEEIINRFIEAELDMLWVRSTAPHQSLSRRALGDNLLLSWQLKRLRASVIKPIILPQLGIAFVAMQAQHRRPA